MNLKPSAIWLPVWLKDGIRALWVRVAIETLLLGILACVPIISAKLSQYAIDEVVMSRSMENLRTLLGLCIVCVTVVLTLKYAAAWICAITRQRFALTVRQRLWSDWMDGVPSDLHPPGEVANRLLGDVFTVGDIAITYVSSSVVCVSTLIVCLVVLFRGNRTLAWIAVSFIPGFLALYFIFGKRISSTARDVRASVDRLVSFIVTRWTQLDEIRSLRGQYCERERFGAAVDDQFEKGMKSLFVQNLSSGVAETLMVAWSLFLFSAGAYLILRDELTLGELIAVQMISGQLVGPVQRLLNLNLSLQIAQVAGERIDEIGKTCEDVRKTDRRKFEYSGLTSLELRDAVCHTAEIGKPDRRISIFVRAIGRVLLSGGNGSGKSSVCRIFAGQRFPVEGSFLVNGIPMEKVDQPSLVEHALLLTHKPYFFAGTLRENLTYGIGENVGDPKLLDVLRRVRLESWVSALDGGLDYRLEDGGRNLSQGQRQRLSCARALLRRQEIVILDEAMSGIEKGARETIIGELENGRCLIVTQTSPSPTVGISAP